MKKININGLMIAISFFLASFFIVVFVNQLSMNKENNSNNNDKNAEQGTFPTLELLVFSTPNSSYMVTVENTKTKGYNEEHVFLSLPRKQKL